jgi:hypothetical protein
MAKCRSLRRATLSAVTTPNDEREVDFSDLGDDLEILPDQTSDDTDRGWGERVSDNDDRLLSDRPPHWD